MELLKIVCIAVLSLMLLSSWGKKQPVLESLAVTAPITMLGRHSESESKSVPAEMEKAERIL